MMARYAFTPVYLTMKFLKSCISFWNRCFALHARAVTYSNYKKHNTVKVFIAVAPNGSIGFISKAWGGRVSDQQITPKWEFLSLLECGDEVLAVCRPTCKLLLPSFTKGKNQLSQKELKNQEDWLECLPCNDSLC